ncbi:MAG: response regulator transcription factor [candidate division KSB1 bacterium]|nr:response regulator transcription factor [candidate division KSB1 bacterium]MDZ7391901.1 response regulator transcription factor [candidate division KSB1 bacterium]MDZ7412492.1 response regulator transcription factor [candidate division KSB1 bacterium]
MRTRSVLFYDPANGKPSSFGSEFSAAGYRCHYATTRTAAMQIVEEHRPDAVVVFIDHCGEDGYAFCRLVRHQLNLRRVALIMVSSQCGEEDIIRGYEAGADEYVSSLKGPRELVARVGAVIRRISDFDAAKIKVKDIEIDLDQQQVRKSGKPLDLTYIQFKLLYLLASRRDKTFSREEILNRVWGRNVCVTTRTVDVHVKRLREKLGERKYPSRYIETVHGTGYRFMQ